jgi:hypothetical protein
LIVGINYYGTDAHLNGCINDAHYIKYLLMHKYGFLEQDMLVLTDDNTDTTRKPTRANFMSGMTWLSGSARPGDSLFFSYSGHGGQTEDVDGDKEGGMDDTIFPMDYKSAGCITDNEIHANLARPLPAGAKLTCVMDCCHSGTAMDLPYEYSNRRLHVEKSVKTKQTQADVVLFSGCLDSQTSADANLAGKNLYSGVLTYAFCQSVEQSTSMTYDGMMTSMQKFTSAKGFSQILQLTSGKPLDLDTPFYI